MLTECRIINTYHLSQIKWTYSLQDNFITKNFYEENREPVYTDKMPLAELLSRSPDENLKPAVTYGCLKSTWVDETCYIRYPYRITNNQTRLWPVSIDLWIVIWEGPFRFSQIGVLSKCSNFDWIMLTVQIQLINSDSLRPKYLKFALHKGVLQSLRDLLCNSWNMDQPKFLINVFHSGGGLFWAVAFDQIRLDVISWRPD